HQPKPSIPNMHRLHPRMLAGTGKCCCTMNGDMKPAILLTSTRYICENSIAAKGFSSAREKPSPYRPTVSGRSRCNRQSHNRNLYCYQLHRASPRRCQIEGLRNTTMLPFFLMDDKFSLLD